jgi:hypothetical protein
VALDMMWSRVGEREGVVVAYIVVQRLLREGCCCWVCCGAEVGE